VSSQETRPSRIAPTAADVAAVSARFAKQENKAGQRAGGSAGLLAALLYIPRCI
jgi:hypothetical protein